MRSCLKTIMLVALAVCASAADARAGAKSTGVTVQIGTYGGSCTNCAVSGQMGDVRSSSDSTEYIGCSLAFYSANKTKLTCTAKTSGGTTLGCTLITGDSHNGHTVTPAIFTVAKSLKSSSYVVFSSSSTGTGGFCENLWVNNGSQYSVLPPTTQYNYNPGGAYNSSQPYNGWISPGNCAVQSDSSGGWFLDESDMHTCRNVSTNSGAFFYCALSADGFTGNYMTGGYDSSGATALCQATDGTNSTSCTTTTPYLVDLFSMVGPSTGEFIFDGNAGACVSGWASLFNGSFTTAMTQQ